MRLHRTVSSDMSANGVLRIIYRVAQKK